MKTERELFEAWFNIDETTNGCRGASALERDQMFAAWQAGRASILKELAEQEPVAWYQGKDYEYGYDIITLDYRLKIGDALYIAPLPTLKE